VGEIVNNRIMLGGVERPVQGHLCFPQEKLLSLWRTPEMSLRTSPDDGKSRKANKKNVRLHQKVPIFVAASDPCPIGPSEGVEIL